jgi:hypothetical protein
MSSRSSEVVQRIDVGHAPDEQAASASPWRALGKTVLYADDLGRDVLSAIALATAEVPRMLE